MDDLLKIWGYTACIRINIRGYIFIYLNMFGSNVRAVPRRKLVKDMVRYINMYPRS